MSEPEKKPEHTTQTQTLVQPLVRAEACVYICTPNACKRLMQATYNPMPPPKHKPEPEHDHDHMHKRKHEPECEPIREETGDLETEEDTANVIMITDRATIACQYARSGWLVVDAMSLAPLELWASDLKMIRLLRLLRPPCMG